jgi:hypothetical protein
MTRDLISPTAGDRISQIIFLALLEAVSGNCSCKTCQLLKQLKEQLVKQALEAT